MNDKAITTVFLDGLQAQCVKVGALHNETNGLLMRSLAEMSKEDFYECFLLWAMWVQGHEEGLAANPPRKATFPADLVLTKAFQDKLYDFGRFLDTPAQFKIDILALKIAEEWGEEGREELLGIAAIRTPTLLVWLL